MTMLLTVNTVVYPDVEYANTETAFLQLLIVMVCFTGPPIKISASISKEYKGITLPVIHTKAWSAHQSDIDQEDSAGDFPIPFLPLAPMFDPMDTCHWATLSKDIKWWLVNDVQMTSIPQWACGHDAFWLAYIAAHPTFPNGSWSVWDPRIPMEGQFIEEWLNDDGINGSTDGMSSNETTEHTLLFNIWESFSRHIALFYPFILIPVS
ncbi:hypothetical protein F5J12DRAFT_832058 [Pisolithus orientalis]|uniref:uncharacterized protein n=1 Tax=Pisolithus orientalis TaxID=936130 RepID=UPI0022250918|nr:uncharacterized protein F5J12DRAFT_832058 [Pisolithus orientalis]KAI6006653.1 hypothetical protein F5J12DRAFT_832058 [Pisolithus orientalis]